MMKTGAGLATALLMGGAVLTAGCSNDSTAGKTSGNATTPVSAPSTPAPPTPSATPRKRRTLKAGVKNADVRYMQKRLKELKYDPGKADGRYGSSTVMAVYAFQKVNRLKPKSTVGKKFWAALEAPKQPPALKLKKPGKAKRVEINLKRQLVVVYKDGEPALISHSSSGHGRAYCDKDTEGNTHCGVAVTPPGDFKTGRHASGWETSPLGKLYKSVYFNGGIALHGSYSIPLYPASHGCVRLPIHTADKFHAMVGVGWPVHVRGKR